MSIAIISAVLGNFDTLVDPVEQTVKATFKRWTDDNFPPITGLTGRAQYRIPKTHGWQMLPDYDYYLWLDGAVSLEREDCLEWYLDQLGDSDIALFNHPFRKSIEEEVDHIEDHLARNRPYITQRYKGGLHREFLTRIRGERYPDTTLYASTAFIYRNTPRMQSVLTDWWYLGTRYFTCDQVQLPYVLWKYNIRVKELDASIYDTKYLSMVSKH